MMDYFMENEKMKKSFMILIAAVLLLSLAGVVSADEITNISKKSYANTIVTLDLANDYKVTIPPAASLQRTTKDNIVIYTGYMQLDVAVTLLPEGQSLYVNVTSEMYSADTNNRYNWTLSQDEGGGNFKNLTYYMKKSQYHESEHIEGTDITTPHGNDQMLEYGETVIETTTGITTYIHMRVIDTPKDTGEYRDNLKFTVNIV